MRKIEVERLLLTILLLKMDSVMYLFRFHTEIKETTTMSKNKAQQRNRRRGSQERARRDLIYKEDGQEYAEVQKALGDGRFTMQCYDNISRIGKIRGKDHRRMWIGVGDLILLSLRDFEDEKADIIHKYSTEEARSLQVPIIFEVNNNEQAPI